MTSAIPLLATALIALLILLIAIGMVVVVVRRRQDRNGQALARSEDKPYEGEWMGMGIAIGLALGMALGVLMGVFMDNMALGIALGPGMGVAVGVAIGSALEQKHKADIRPLTPQERRPRMWLLGITLGLGLLVLSVVLASIFLLNL